MTTSEFKLDLAIVIGINDYGNGIPQLGTARQDAEEIAQILRNDYHYRVHLITDLSSVKPTSHNLMGWLDTTLPAILEKESPSRLLFYFAGHGIALNNDDGPQGYLILQDGKLGDVSTYLPMQKVETAISKLPCRHCLVILDCCFAGAFRWSNNRKFVSLTATIHKERYDRFIQDPAWQVITSAASDQYANDSLAIKSDRGIANRSDRHSPFAAALMDALTGAADTHPPAVNGKPPGDGVITATELYMYLRDAVEPATEEKLVRQTPGIWSLKKHDKGEYIFLAPGHQLNLPPAPPLDESKNPYRGLESFEEEHGDFFFGRTESIKKLSEFVNSHSMTVVLGASGSGKSSLVKAGLVPFLKCLKSSTQWQILAPFRPGESPLKALNKTLAMAQLAGESITALATDEKVATLSAHLEAWSQQYPNHKMVLVVDQFEELITLCHDDGEREQFLNLLAGAVAKYSERLRLILTLRSDFEPQFRDTALKEYWDRGRFVVSPMTRGDLREAIEEPAFKQVMYLQSDDPKHPLTDLLIDEVADMPGALPLLSFTLSELYRKYLKRQREAQNAGVTIDRSLVQADYQALGGVIQSLTRKADEEYEKLVKRERIYAQIVRYTMLRMVALGGGGLERRQVSLSELEYAPPEDRYVKEVINHFTKARLLVKGQDPEGNSYVEPAHDALVKGWKRLLDWKQQEEETILLQRRLTPAAEEWATIKSKERYLKPGAKTEPSIDWLDRKLYSVEELFNKSTNRLVRLWQRKKQQQKHSIQRNTDFLWHGNPYLDLLAQKLQSNNNWLNRVESKFVKESILQKRRNRSWRFRIAIAVIVGLSVLTIATQIGWQEAARQGISAQQQMLRTENESARLLSSSGRDFDALLLALKAGTHFQQASWRRQAGISPLEVNALQELVYGIREKNRFIGHKDSVYGVSFSPDGQTVASASGDRTIKIWTADGSVERTLTGHIGAVHQVKFSPDGKTLASASADRTVKLWKSDGTLRKTLTGHTDTVYSVAFSPDGHAIASGSADGTIKLWNSEGVLLHSLADDSSSHQVSDGTQSRTQPPPDLESFGVRDVSFSPDSQTIASASGNTIQLWSQTGKLLKTIAGYNRPVSSVNFSPNGQILAATSEDGTIRLWQKDGKPIIKIYEGNVVHQVKFSPDGKTIASASADPVIKLWNLDGSLQQSFTGHDDSVYGLSFSPNGRAIASASGDRTVRLWQPDGISLATFRGHQGDVYKAAFSPDGQILASVGADKVVRLWKPNGEVINALKGHKDLIHGVAFSPDGKTIASASWDGTVNLWQEDGTLIKSLKGHTGKVYGIAFSPQGDMLASTSGDGTIKTWDRQGNLLKTLRGHTDVIHNISFSPDGKFLVSASHDKTARLWSRDGRLIKTLVGHTNWVHGVAFSPDGQTIASASHDRTVKLWNLDGKLLDTLQGHAGRVKGVAFSPDSQTVASASEDRTIRLWRRSDGTQIAILRGHGDTVHAIEFSPDGNALASASEDNTVILWDLKNLNDLETLLAKGCNWMRGYLKNNATLQESDRLLCDDVPKLVAEDRSTNALAANTSK